LLTSAASQLAAIINRQIPLHYCYCCSHDTGSLGRSLSVSFKLQSQQCWLLEHHSKVIKRTIARTYSCANLAQYMQLRYNAVLYACNCKEQRTNHLGSLRRSSASPLGVCTFCPDTSRRQFTATVTYCHHKNKAHIAKFYITILFYSLNNSLREELSR
jgi:hypothetical protein